MNEEWKDIKGYEGLYQVSNLGRVKSLERIDINNHPVKEKILKLSNSTTGYWKVALSKNGKHLDKKVHRLVAEAFIPNLEQKPFVNHIDSNRKNNIITNLEWCTQKENMYHARINHRMSQYKIDDLDHEKIIKDYLKNGNVKQIAKKNNVSKDTIFRVLRIHKIEPFYKNYLQCKGFSDELLVLLFKTGKTDKEIYEFIGCAKSTLRRKKKQLMEE